MAFCAQWLVAPPALLAVAAILWRKRWFFDLITAALSGAAAIGLAKMLSHHRKHQKRT